MFRSICAGILGILLVFGIATPLLSNEAEILEIEVTVSPSTLVLDSAGVWVTVHTNIAYGLVNSASLSLNGVEIAWTKADNRGNLVGKFNLDDVKSIIAPPTATLTMSGVCNDGTPFSGSDTVAVKASSAKKPRPEARPPVIRRISIKGVGRR